jgi:hypothetical protein
VSGHAAGPRRAPTTHRTACANAETPVCRWEADRREARPIAGGRSVAPSAKRVGAGAARAMQGCHAACRVSLQPARVVLRPVRELSPAVGVNFGGPALMPLGDAFARLGDGPDRIPVVGY